MEDERKKEEIREIKRKEVEERKGEKRGGETTKPKARVDKVMKQMMGLVGKAKVDTEEIASITLKGGGVKERWRCEGRVCFV